MPRNQHEHRHCKSMVQPSIAAIFMAASILTACGDDSKTADNSISGSDEGIVAISDKTISGVTQKGPFVNGSSVTVQELDGETLAQTGSSFEGKIKNDLGEFSVKVKTLESQYALLKANGFYRNEVTGKKSKSQVTLYALTDLSKRNEANINLLTHLAYERTLYLATEEGISVTEAKKQAESEILKSFGIEGDFAAAEDLNIFGESDQNAALLAISILMQGDLSEADFSERLANYAADIETDGVWNDIATATRIADWANAQWSGSGLAKIRENIAKWELSADVPMFEKYVNNFWWHNYGLETCDTKREGEILKNQNTVSTKVNEYYICKFGTWQIASDIEKDSYNWLDPTAKRTEKDGDVRYGDVIKTNCYVYEDKIWRSGNANDCSLDLRGCTKLRQDTVGKGSDNVWHICDALKWRNAKAIEYDTYKWEPGKDGDSKIGDIDSKNCYVFENEIWRIGNVNDCSLNLRGCTSIRQDTVALGSDKAWYICNAKTWRNATTYEKDTFGWKDSTDGAIKKGNVTDTVYVFDKTAWRAMSDVETKLGICVAAISDSIGKVNTTYYICKANSWKKATPLEYDTYKWASGKDGDSKQGNVNTKNCYVYDSSTTYKGWRTGNSSDCSLGLGGCTTGREGKIIKQGSYYVCEANSWREATANEEISCQTDCFCEVCTKNKQGTFVNKNGTQYVCDELKWREPNCAEKATKSLCTANDSAVVWNCEDNADYICSETYDRKITWHQVRNPFEHTLADWMEKKKKYYSSKTNSSVVYGEDYTDPRDKNVYKTVVINGYRVFAENLRYADSVKTENLKGQTWCYNNEEKNCVIGGRYYTWTAAVNLHSKWQDGLAKEYIDKPHQGICPEGWHIPTNDEWNSLFKGIEFSAQRMKGFAEWPATDESGFAAIPIGGLDLAKYINDEASFWSTDETTHEFFNETRYDAFIWMNSTLTFQNNGLVSTSKESSWVYSAVRCFENKAEE